MKMLNRDEFMKSPSGTIFSDPGEEGCTIISGLFCKMSGPEYGPDFVVQDLISEHGFPDDIDDGMEAFLHVQNLRDTGQKFEMDLDCSGRNGMFNQDQKFIVWDKSDIEKLISFLSEAVNQAAKDGDERNEPRE